MMQIKPEEVADWAEIKCLNWYVQINAMIVMPTCRTYFTYQQLATSVRATPALAPRS